MDQSAVPVRQEGRHQQGDGQCQDADPLAAQAERAAALAGARGAAEHPAPAGDPVLALGEEQHQVAGGREAEPDPAATFAGQPVAHRVERQQRQPGQGGAPVRHRDGVHHDGDQPDRADQHQPQARGGRCRDRVLPDVVQPVAEHPGERLHRLGAGDHPAELVGGAREADQQQHQQHEELPERHRPAVEGGAAQARTGRRDQRDHQDGVGDPALGGEERGQAERGQGGGQRRVHGQFGPGGHAPASSR